MEEDRAQTDLGIAADIEEAQNYEAAQRQPAPAQVEAGHENVVKQPKKRFVGRRAATEAGASKGATPDGEAGAVQCEFFA